MLEAVLLLILLSIVIALLALSIRYKKISGIISVIGLVSLGITSSLKECFQIQAQLSHLGFPESVDAIQNMSETAEKLEAKAAAMMPWIIVSGVFLLIGIFWLIVEFITNKQNKKRNWT